MGALLVYGSFSLRRRPAVDLPLTEGNPACNVVSLGLR